MKSVVCTQYVRSSEKSIVHTFAKMKNGMKYRGRCHALPWLQGLRMVRGRDLTDLSNPWQLCRVLRAVPPDGWRSTAGRSFCWPVLLVILVLFFFLKLDILVGSMRISTHGYWYTIC